MLRAEFGEYNSLAVQPQKGFLKKTGLQASRRSSNFPEFSLASNSKWCYPKISVKQSINGDT